MVFLLFFLTRKKNFTRKQKFLKFEKKNQRYNYLGEMSISWKEVNNAIQEKVLEEITNVLLLDIGKIIAHY